VIRVVLGLTLALLPNGAAGAGSRDVPRMVDADAQLAHALACKGALRGLEGVERERSRAVAVEAYGAVAAYFPKRRALCAQAAFRAGELLRAGGDPRRAAEAFLRAIDLGRGTLFRPRARIELAHVHRRAGRRQAALAEYERVLFDPDATPHLRDLATSWAAHVQSQLGRESDARRLWERVARAGEDPLDQVRAFDRWALSLVAGGELEAAAGVLELCRTRLRDRALEQTALGERLRDALERMRSVGPLARAIRSRRQLPMPK